MEMQTIKTRMDELVDIIGGYAYLVNDEKFLQGEIADVLGIEGVSYEREVHLSTGIIDFMVGDIGVEVKVHQESMSVYRQLERYAKDPRLKGIILASVRTGVTVPEDISGKPAAVVEIHGGLF